MEDGLLFSCPVWCLKRDYSISGSFKSLLVVLQYCSLRIALRVPLWSLRGDPSNEVTTYFSIGCKSRKKVKIEIPSLLHRLLLLINHCITTPSALSTIFTASCIPLVPGTVVSWWWVHCPSLIPNCQHSRIQKGPSFRAGSSPL